MFLGTLAQPEFCLRCRITRLLLQIMTLAQEGYGTSLGPWQTAGKPGVMITWVEGDFTWKLRPQDHAAGK